jgi:hypothetical protein
VDFRGLDLNLILLLEALIRDPNQTRVAKALRISQPTVSASLAKLRKVLKDELIVKSGATYKATPRLQSLGARLTRPNVPQVSQKTRDMARRLHLKHTPHQEGRRLEPATFGVTGRPNRKQKQRMFRLSTLRKAHVISGLSERLDGVYAASR